MTHTEDKHNQAKSDMLGEFNKAILDAEERRKAATKVPDVAPAEKPGSAGAGPMGPSIP
jgi:hypothetical protein